MEWGSPAGQQEQLEVVPSAHHHDRLPLPLLLLLHPSICIIFCSIPVCMCTRHVHVTFQHCIVGINVAIHYLIH